MLHRSVIVVFAMIVLPACAPDPAQIASMNMEQVRDAARWHHKIVRERAFELNPWWDADIRAAIRRGRVVTGMTRDQVLLSWGRPWAIDTSKTANNTYETWRYGYYDEMTSLNFVNGRLEIINEFDR